MTRAWKRDDRVYVVSEPEVVGTVISATNGSVLIARDDWRGPFTGTDGMEWYLTADLEHYTLPAPEYDYTLRETLDAIAPILNYLEGQYGQQDLTSDDPVPFTWYSGAIEFLEARYDRIQHELKQYGRKYPHVA